MINFYSLNCVNFQLTIEKKTKKKFKFFAEISQLVNWFGDTPYADKQRVNRKVAHPLGYKNILNYLLDFGKINK